MVMHTRALRRFPDFGRRKCALLHDLPAARSGLADDLRLFALTFAGGFLFISVYLA